MKVKRFFDRYKRKAVLEALEAVRFSVRVDGRIVQDTSLMDLVLNQHELGRDIVQMQFPESVFLEIATDVSEVRNKGWFK